MTHTSIRKPLSVLLSILMVLSVFGGMSLTSYAAPKAAPELPDAIKDCIYRDDYYGYYANVPFAETGYADMLDGAIILDGITLDATNYSYRFYDQNGTEIEAPLVYTADEPGTMFGLSEDVTIYVKEFALPDPLPNPLYIVATAPAPAAAVITWMLDEDTVIDTTDVAYGEVPTHADPTKDADTYYTYAFAGWTPAIEAVTGDATYTATFNAAAKMFTVNVKKLTGETYAVEVTGETTVAELKELLADPAEIPAAEQRIIFAGRELEDEKALSEYNIQRGSTLHLIGKAHTITWNNDDGTLIDTTNVAYGRVPTHDDPVKEADAQYIYTFAGWSPEVTAVTGDATYTATYTREVNPDAPPHEHSFTYAADAATLTATCQNDGCGLPDSAVSFTINAPAKTRYSDRKSAAATLTGVDAFNEATGKTVSADDIVYYKGEQQLDAAPENAGTYQARITVEGATAVVEYTIAKLNPVVFVPGTRNATYGDTLADVTLPAGWSWKDDLSTSVGNAGVKTFTAVYTPDDTENYNTREVDVTVNVAKANPDYQIPANLTATEGDTLADVTLPDGWTWQDSTEPVGAVGEKTFKATFTPADTANYNVVENIDVTVTVSAKTPDDPEEPATPTDPDAPAEEGVCPFCCKTHNGGFLDRRTGWVHYLLALLTAVFNFVTAIR